MKPIAVLGAGIAGLVAAREFVRKGLPVIVFEAGKSVGGMASSFVDEKGYTYDLGAHFVSNRLASELGAGTICRTVHHYGEAVLVGKSVYTYPFGLMRSPRYAASALSARFQKKPTASAGDWFRKNYGDALAEDVAIPITEAWSGAKASDLAPAVGDKMGPGVAKSLYLKAAARMTGRAVCNGYSHEMPEGASLYHVYPEGGIASLLKPTTDALGDCIRLNSRVEGIFAEDGRVQAIRVNGEDLPVSAVMSTAPVNVLPKLVRGTDKLDHLAHFRYRPMIFVNLRFEGRGHLPDTMLWIPDRTKAFFRITETPISMPWLAPEGKTLMTFDIGAEIGDRYWTMSNEEIAKACLDGFCEIYPHLRSAYIGLAAVMKTPLAYPVYLREYEAERRAFARTTGVDGLYSIGRNGEFAHILMEDIYWRTLARTRDAAFYVSGTSANDQLDALGEAVAQAA